MGRWSARRAALLRDARVVVVAAVLAGACGFFLTFVGKSYAIKDWLFWIYLKCWGLSALFFLACVLAGNGTLLRVLRRPLPLVEHVVSSFAIGAFEFFLVLFLVGLCGGLGWPLFFGLPVALIALGLRPGLRLFRRARRHIAAARRKRPPSWSLAELAIAIAGCAALLVLYAPILTPDNVAYDARWYHLPLAEHYAALGAVRRFPEGWFFGAYPHMASFFYTWAMLMPHSRYFEHVELCAHIEFVFFLVTLAGIPALARVLLPGLRAHLSWVSVFLFPELFAYDSSLHTGADHIAALWAIPIVTFLVRGLRARSPVLLGFFSLMAAGALDTKFTAVTIVIVPVLAALFVCVYRVCAGPLRQGRMLALRCLLACAAVGLLATAPNWLKNWIWYGDPIYPKLAKYLTLRPATPDFQVPFDNWFYSPEYRAAHDWQGVKAALGQTVQFSFYPSDWSTFHGTAPLFGSLFTLCLAAVPFLGKRPRLWFMVAATHVGVFVWYELHHFDRYLQTLMPWMAACVTVCLVLVWRLHWLPRIPLAALVASQLVWGGDAPFLGNHAMSGSTLTRAIELLGAGPKGEGEKRFRKFESSFAVGLDLPAGAKVLVHEQHIHWGLMHTSVSDWQGSQGGISYVRAGSIAGVYDTLAEMGVTDLMWSPGMSRGGDTLGSDFLFFAFAKFATKGQRTISDQSVAHMPASRPLDTNIGELAAIFDCPGRYATGLYRVTRLVKSDFDPERTYPTPDYSLADSPSETEASAALRKARFAAVNARCHVQELGLVAGANLLQIAVRGDLLLYARQEP